MEPGAVPPRHEGRQASADAGAPDSPAALAPPRHRSGLADRGRQRHRRRGAAGARRRPGRGAGAGRVGRALERWPASGVPDNPGAWLMTTAKNRARDRLRLDALHSRSTSRSARAAGAGGRCGTGFRRRAGRRAPGRYRRRSAAVDLHGLPSAAVHRGARGADAAAAGRPVDAEIARAFLASESTIAQRIVRAKRSLSARACRSRCPAGERRAAGLGAGSDLPDLQRRLFRHVGRELDTAGAGAKRCAWAASWRNWRTATARRTAWSR